IRQRKNEMPIPANIESKAPRAYPSSVVSYEAVADIGKVDCRHSGEEHQCSDRRAGHATTHHASGMTPALLLLSRFRLGAEHLGPPPEHHFDLPAEEAHHSHAEAPMAWALAVLRARLRRWAEEPQHLGLRDALDNAAGPADGRIVGVVDDARLQAGAKAGR